MYCVPVEIVRFGINVSGLCLPADTGSRRPRVKLRRVAIANLGWIMKSRGPRGATALDKYIGLRLRTRRLMLDMTQSDLAKVIGLTFQQLQKYEKGTNRVSATTLQKLAATMKVPITYFFEGGSCEN